MLAELRNKTKAVSVTGLGYVGLPLALEFAKKFRVIGFDIKQNRIDRMKQGIDPSEELDSSAFTHCDIEFTTDPDRLRDAHFHIVGVPTDIDEHKVPNLEPLRKSSESVGRALKRGDIVVYESTVYPGCTEEVCLPILEKTSGLKLGKDFGLGYSPERIVPGDREKTLTTILKIVSGSDDATVETIDAVYNSILRNGTYRASSIKVAEAAKVIENTQRDINISLMNELAIIFDKMDIDTREVIEAAGTKWNFHKYFPGLVGGHCISVDPFYLIHKARKLGIEPQVIAAGRRVNDQIPHFIAKTLVQKLISKGKNPGDCKVLVKGVTFKEDVSDIRNSKVMDLIRELQAFSIEVDVNDPYASVEQVLEEYGIEIGRNEGKGYDAVIVAVGHKEYLGFDAGYFRGIMKDKPVLFDIKAVYNRNMEGIDYWSL